MKTPFDYLTTTINGESLSNAYEIGFKAGIKEVVEWLINYNLHQFPEEYKVLWQYKLKEWGCL